MRRPTLAVAAIAAATLAACSTSTSAPNNAAKASASSTPTVDKQAQFLAAVHNASIASWAINAPTDAELAAYPDKWCAALNDGHSVTYILSSGGAGLYPAGMSWGTKKADTARVLVMAVTAYCPSQRAGVVQQLQASGDW